MRVATKVGLGSILSIALLVSVIAYNIGEFRGLVAAQRDSSAMQFETATLTLGQLRLLDEIEEILRKYFVTEDTAYAERIVTLLESFDQRTRMIHRSQIAEDVRGPWSEVEELLLETGPLLQPQSLGMAVAVSDSSAELSRRLLDLRRLRRRVRTTLDAVQLSAAKQVSQAGRANREVESAAWLAVSFAVLLSLVVVALTVRAIRRPVHDLARAARAVGGGDLSHEIALGKNNEFSQVAEDFNAMIERLREVDRIKREFVSRVSHDLKTPLIAMQETHRLLLQGLPGPLNERQRQLLQLSVDGGERLSGMLSKLLDLATLESDGVSFELKRTELGALVRSVVASAEASAEARDLALELPVVDRPIWARVDGDRLQQVLENLLENAIKFSPSGARIEVRIERAARPDRLAPAEVLERLDVPRRTNGWVRWTVSDRGPGVPDHDKLRVFDRFQQVDGRNDCRVAAKQSRTQRLGVGLGLAICREIVDAHRGAIWVQDRLENGRCCGSVFSVLLPLQRELRSAAPRGLTPAAAAAAT